jgi:hypothetical protein
LQEEAKRRVAGLTNGFSRKVNEMTNTPLDVLKLSDEIERDSQSGALHNSMLEQGQTLYEPDPDLPHVLRRWLPSGGLERGTLSNGKFVVIEVILKGESDQ